MKRIMTSLFILSLVLLTACFGGKGDNAKEVMYDGQIAKLQKDIIEYQTSTKRAEAAEFKMYGEGIYVNILAEDNIEGYEGWYFYSLDVVVATEGDQMKELVKLVSVAGPKDNVHTVFGDNAVGLFEYKGIADTKENGTPFETVLAADVVVNVVDEDGETEEVVAGEIVPEEQKKASVTSELTYDVTNSAITFTYEDNLVTEAAVTIKDGEKVVAEGTIEAKDGNATVAAITLPATIGVETVYTLSSKDIIFGDNNIVTVAPKDKPVIEKAESVDTRTVKLTLKDAYTIEELTKQAITIKNTKEGSTEAAIELVVLSVDDKTVTVKTTTAAAVLVDAATYAVTSEFFVAEDITFVAKVAAVTADVEAPVITLNGNAKVVVKLGDTYDDEGATAEDNVDGDLTDKIKVENDVDTEKEGTYKVTYTVADAAGNEATVTRTVTVKVTVEEEVVEELTVVSVSAINDAVEVEFGTTYEDVIAALDATVEGTVADEEEAVEIAVEWNENEEYNGEVATEYIFTGTLVAPEGYVFAEEVVTEVTATVTVLEEVVELTVVSVQQFDGVTVTLGDEDFELPATVTATLNDEEATEVELAIAWDEFEIEEVGEFVVYGAIVLDEDAEYTISEELELVSVTVTVISVEDAALEAAETAVAAYEEVDEEAITEYAQVEGIEALEEAAREAVAELEAGEVQDALVERIDEKKDEIDAVLDGHVDAVNAAGNMIDLFEALDAFWTVDIEYMVTYWDLHQEPVDMNDVHEIQDNVVEAVTDALLENEIILALGEAVESGNLLNLKAVLEEYEGSFKRLNLSSAHLNQYMEDITAKFCDFDPKNNNLPALTAIQDDIDGANLTLADLEVAEAEADASQAKLDSAEALVLALDEVGQKAQRDNHIATLAEHQLILDVVNATAANLEDALEALEDHTDGDDFEAVVYEALLADYVAGLAEAKGNEKNTVAGIDLIFDEANEAAQTAALDKIFAVTEDTKPADFLTMLNNLAAISDFVVAEHVNEAWLADYIGAIVEAEPALVTTGVVADDIQALIDELENFNDDQAAGALNVLLLGDEEDADDVLQALKDLLLTGIVDANKDFYFAEVEFLAFDKDTNFDNVDLQEVVVDNGNTVEAVLNAADKAAMRTALFDLDDAFLTLSPAVKTEFAGYVFDELAEEVEAPANFVALNNLVFTTYDTTYNTLIDDVNTAATAADDDSLTDMITALGNIFGDDFNDESLEYKSDIAFAVLEDANAGSFKTIAEIVAAMGL